MAGLGLGPSLRDIVSRFAQPREIPVALTRHLPETFGASLSGELEAWCELFEAYELEVSDPSGAEFRVVSADLDLSAHFERSSASSLAELVGFFAATSLVAQVDEMSYLAAWCGASSGASRIFSFHPSDWGLWLTDRSLTELLLRLLRQDRDNFIERRLSADEERAFEQTLAPAFAVDAGGSVPKHLDPALLFRRTLWLIHALTGVGRDWMLELEDCAPWATYLEEKVEIPRWPHLAAYWLWFHALFDNRESLEETLSLTSKSPHPIVRESRTLVKRIAAGQRARVGSRTTEVFQEISSMWTAEAPRSFFSPEALERHGDRRRVAGAEDGSEQRAMVLLREAARAEPKVEEALLLLEHLSVGGANRPATIPVRGGISVDQAMARLADLVDARFRPVLFARLERGARVPDTDRRAGSGFILAFAAISSGFAEFHALMTKLGTELLGVRRKAELYRAYGRFEDPEALEMLAVGAQRWLNQIDDWIKTEPDEPLYQLLARNTRRTEELMRALLERATFSPSNWDVCVHAAWTAGQLRSVAALPGLRRAVRERLGRIEDGTRTKVVLALHRVEEDGGFLVLYDLVRSAFTSLANADEDARSEIEYSVASWLAGLLPAAPQHDEVLGWTRMLLASFMDRLRQRRAPRRELLASTLAILEGLKRGDMGALSDLVERLRDLSVQENHATAGMGARVRAVARSVLEGART